MMASSKGQLLAVRGLCLALGLCALLFAYSRERKPQKKEASSQAPLSSRGEAHPWVSAVLEANQQADRARTPEERRVAVRGLGESLSAIGADTSEAAGLMRQDLSARMARLLMENGDTSEAESVALRGTSYGLPMSAFQTELLLLLAEIAKSKGEVALAESRLKKALAISEHLLD